MMAVGAVVSALDSKIKGCVFYSRPGQNIGAISRGICFFYLYNIKGLRYV